MFKMRFERTGGLVFGAVLVVLVSGSLAACTSTVPPKQTSAHNCTPNSAHISWGSPVSGKREPVEAHLISFEDGVLISTPITTEADTHATFSYSGERSISDVSSTGETKWQESLLSRLRKTDAVPTDFGNGAPVEPGDFTPSTPSGKYVVVTEENLTTVPFTISCAGEKSLAGEVAAVADTGSYGTIEQCGTSTESIAPEIVSIMGPACTQE